MLFLPGGRKGSENLLNSELVKKWCVEFAKTKKLAAICAAPSVLARFGLLEGKNATCYPGMEGGMHGAIMSGETVTLVAENPAIPPQVFTGAETGRLSVLGLAVAFTHCLV